MYPVRNYYPVWRELKRSYIHIIIPCCQRSELLSRLKGMETYNRTIRLALLGFRSELLSRLKGMETVIVFAVLLMNSVRNYFPVWRELKRVQRIGICWYGTAPFGKTIPFEGNGNQPITNAVISSVAKVRNYYPVWREWKLCYTCVGDTTSLLFGATIPFEGNGNVIIPLSLSFT